MSRSESQSMLPASSRALSEGGVRGRNTERCVRWVMRRRQCKLMIGVNLLLMFVLIGIFCWMYYATLDHRVEMRRLKRERRVLKRVANNITFLHCKFVDEDPTKVNFTTDMCHVETVDYAKVVRFHYKNDSQSTCINLYEEGPCHEYLESERKKPENASRVPKRFTKIKQCRGLLGVSMPGDSYAPALDNAHNLTALLGTTVLASELVVKCPRCKQMTDLFWIAPQYMPQLKQLHGKKDAELCGYLLTKIETEDKGWPAVAQQCDRFGTTDAPDLKCDSQHPLDMTKPWEDFVLHGEAGDINSTSATATVI